MINFSFHHVAISVSDAPRSMAFYSNFGFHKVAEWCAPDQSLRIIHMKLDGMLLELFEYRDFHAAPLHTAELQSDLEVIGCKHFGLRVASLTDVVAELQENGLHPVSEIKRGRTGPLYCFYKDPDGIFVELLQDDRVFE